VTDDYTPPTEDVRNHYAHGCGPKHTREESRADFDRWLAAHEQKVREPLEAKLAEADKLAKDWYEAYERASDRVIALRERLAEWRDENQAHEIYPADEHQAEECTDECAWCALDAILNDTPKETR